MRHATGVPHGEPTVGHLQPTTTHKAWVSLWRYDLSYQSRLEPNEMLRWKLNLKHVSWAVVCCKSEQPHFQGIVRRIAQFRCTCSSISFAKIIRNVREISNLGTFEALRKLWGSIYVAVVMYDVRASAQASWINILLVPCSFFTFSSNLVFRKWFILHSDSTAETAAVFWKCYFLFIMNSVNMTDLVHQRCWKRQLSWK